MTSIHRYYDQYPRHAVGPLSYHRCSSSQALFSYILEDPGWVKAVMACQAQGRPKNLVCCVGTHAAVAQESPVAKVGLAR